MASVLSRLLAALRGASIPSLAGREPNPFEPRIRRAEPRTRQSTSAPPDGPLDRAARAAGLRVRRLRQIAAFYVNGAHDAVVTVGDCPFLPNERFHAAAELIVHATGERASALAGIENALRKTMLKRRLGELSDRERAILRACDLLCELGEFERAEALRIRLPIVWSEGRCQMAAPGFGGLTRTNALRSGLDALFGEFATAAPDSIDRLRRAWRSALSLDATLSEEEHKTLESYQFIDRWWLAPSEAADDARGPAALALGLFAGTDRALLYDNSHGLITLSPSGSAKRQGQIALGLTRLLTGAVVIDVDGNAFQATARVRKKTVGKICAFAPALADHSMHYNPLDAVARDAARAWPEALLLADLLTGRDGPDEEARNFVAPAILDVAINERPERRHMRAVLARLTCTGQQLDAWRLNLARSRHPELVRHAETLRRLAPDRREALLERLRPELAVWQSVPLADVLDRTDWTATDLRRRATLYLCVDRRDIERYAVVLRVIIGQMLAALGREKATSPGTTVTFFLDELARLGPMAAVARVVETGPECGVRPWMFFANSAEMRAVYANADAMAANCAAHCYIAPDPDSAHELALRLGFVKSLFGTDEKPVASPADLAGREFADNIVALVGNQPPARLVLPGELKTAQRRRR